MIFLVLLVVVIGFALIARLIISYAARVTEKMMNGRFKDVETIINNKSVPETWIEQVEIREQFLRMFYLNSPNRKEKEKKLIINRLEKLIKYFKKCPFFENPESRSSALDTLEKTRIDWGNKQELIDRGNQKIY